MDLDSKLVALFMSTIQGQVMVNQVRGETIEAVKVTKELKLGLYSTFNPPKEQKVSLTIFSWYLTATHTS